jgi:4-alpha-glucanotransferase
MVDNLPENQDMNQDTSQDDRGHRRAGILLHLTSLPGNAATGDLGADAFRFVDFLQAAGMGIWQMLPIGPTQEGGSPYQTTSVHAGNPELINLVPLVEEGWLPPEILEGEITTGAKDDLLRQAWHAFSIRAGAELRAELDRFIDDERYWLDDYALFRALHQANGNRSWWEWPAPLRKRESGALKRVEAQLGEQLAEIRFQQFNFYRQWMRLKQYANERGVLLFGDMPIFVAHDSAEVWAHQQMFDLDQEGHTRVVAGVPPDYFSSTGQRWGNPLYRWDRMEENGFSFWIERMKSNLRLFDLVRVDHFRGFEAYWEIPAEEQYAVNGRWVEAPGDALFERLHQVYDPLPLVAENLGVITPAVEALRRKYALPGMKILQFAFSGDTENPYLPFRHEVSSVVYTGTHDNDTTLGWYLELNDATRQHVDEYLGYSREPMPWPLIRTAFASCSYLAVIPLQDALGLDGSHRMNMPGTTEGNWSWRFQWDQMDDDLAPRLRRRVEMYGRI